MKKSSEYASELLPVLLCFSSIESIPSLEKIISKSIIEAKQDLLEDLKSKVNDQNLLSILENYVID